MNDFEEEAINFELDDRKNDSNVNTRFKNKCKCRSTDDDKKKKIYISAHEGIEKKSLFLNIRGTV